MSADNCERYEISITRCLLREYSRNALTARIGLVKKFTEEYQRHARVVSYTRAFIS